MPRTCSVCRNPRRDSINEALLTGQSLRNVAERFGTSVTSLHRHRKEIPKKIVKATEARDIVLGDTLLSQVQGLIGKAVAILERAEASGDDRCALQAVREVLFAIQKIAGHSTITVSQRYVHPTPERVEDAFSRFESYNARKAAELEAKRKSE